MEGVLMVSDLSWIQRGVAKEIPDKIKLNDEELKNLIEGAIPESTDIDTDLDDGEEDSEQQKLKGIRGNNVELQNEETDFEKKYMKGYTEETTDEQAGEDGMKGIAMYSTNKDDPYVTEQVDSDEEEEKDEIMVRKDDNMVAVAKIDKGDFTLECYVYNEADSDWYCHHDYILDAPPLCIEPVQHDPGNEETGKGNLIAVGTMNSEIHIWDLDIMNTATPFLTLGKKRRK
uniref:WD_REPEATS_REGION domain-containing protein n=1 Tax=Caenorhabditis tropicalis TaxID=1561998 RepID=A0A1I7TE75_9PELO